MADSVALVCAMAALVGLIYIVFAYNKRTPREMMTVPTHAGVAMPTDPSASNLRGVDYPSTVSGDAATVPTDCFPKDRLTAQDLLPKDAANEKWARVNPSGQGDVDDKNYLNAGHHYGVDTIAGSLRNANLQLRSEPPNPRSRVSVWNQSTIEPDLNRRPFEIDASC